MRARNRSLRIVCSSRKSRRWSPKPEWTPGAGGKRAEGNRRVAALSLTALEPFLSMECVFIVGRKYGVKIAPRFSDEAPACIHLSNTNPQGGRLQSACRAGFQRLSIVGISWRPERPKVVGNDAHDKHKQAACQPT